MSKKAWIITGSVMGGLALALGGFIIFANSPISPFIPRAGGITKMDAKKIGKTAKLEEKRIKVKGHEFTYYNVKSDNDGNWILVDKSSYIINKDIQFGFRFKNEGTKIDSYEAQNPVIDMGPYSNDITYNSYQVDFGFKITISDSTDMTNYPNGVNLGIFEHWC